MSTLNRIHYRECPEHDAELWVVNHTDWSLPVVITRVTHNGEQYLRVRRACVLDVKQAVELDKFMSARAVGRGQTGWVLTEELFTHVATKAPGITPERYVRWNEPLAEPDPVRPTKAKAAPPADEFLAEVCNRLGAKPEAMHLVWHVICQTIPDWLLSGKDLDLGYIRLSAVPYRRAWKRLLFARAPGLRNVYRSNDRKRLLRAMLDREHRLFTMTDMASARRKRGHMLLDWTVEVTHAKNWRDLCEQREFDISRRDQAGYVQRWASIIETLMGRIHEIAAEEAEEDLSQTPRAEWDRRARAHRFVVGPATVLVDPLPQCSHPDGPQSLDDIQTAEGKRAAMETTIAGLLDMPPVQPGAADVRDTRECVAPTGDVRVLVPDPGCGEAGGQGLLAQVEGPDGRMAGQPETEVCI